jgi:hypothetical protein
MIGHLASDGKTYTLSDFKGKQAVAWPGLGISKRLVLLKWIDADHEVLGIERLDQMAVLASEPSESRDGVPRLMSFHIRTQRECAQREKDAHQ